MAGATRNIDSAKMQPLISRSRGRYQAPACNIPAVNNIFRTFMQRPESCYRRPVLAWISSANVLCILNGSSGTMATFRRRNLTCMQRTPGNVIDTLVFASSSTISVCFTACELSIQCFESNKSKFGGT